MVVVIQSLVIPNLRDQYTTVNWVTLAVSLSPIFDFGGLGHATGSKCKVRDLSICLQKNLWISGSECLGEMDDLTFSLEDSPI